MTANQRDHLFRLLFFVLICVFTFRPLQVFGAPREVQAAGRYAMGDSDSKQDAKRMALLEAKRMALEECGTYLESDSEVKNFQLTKDEISSLAAGIISVQVLDEKWEVKDENMVVTICIKAAIDTSGMEKKIASLRENKEGIDETNELKKQLADLQRQVEGLKNKQAQTRTQEEKTAVKAELDESRRNLLQASASLEYLEEANKDIVNNSPEKALISFNKAILSDKKNLRALVGKSLVLDRLGRSREALDSINIAVRIAPRSARVHGAKALILLHGKEFSGALNEFNQAIDCDPANPKFFFGRSLAYLGLRDKRAAFLDLKHSCDMGFEQACARLQQLKNRRGARPALNRSGGMRRN
ncbi:MAG: hypothetical protein V1736_09925 [Pseudomonadota bacterium]